MNAECVTTKDKIECVWQYSRYYGDMLFTSLRLYDSGEGYSAIAILFNAVELIFKSFRENYEENFNQDIAVLTEAGLLTADEKDFFDNPQYGIRKIRNIMTHREAYQSSCKTKFRETKGIPAKPEVNFTNIIQTGIYSYKGN